MYNENIFIRPNTGLIRENVNSFQFRSFWLNFLTNLKHSESQSVLECGEFCNNNVRLLFWETQRCKTNETKPNPAQSPIHKQAYFASIERERER